MSITTQIKNLTSKLFGARSSSSSSSYGQATSNVVPVITHGNCVLNDVGVASKAVDKVASACMGTEPSCVQNDKIIVTTATKLLKRPNKRMTGDALVYTIVEDIYIGGYSFVVLVGNINSKPSEMHHVDPTKAAIRIDSNGKISRITVTNDDYSGEYVYEDGRYLDRSNPFAELVHIQHPSGRSILNSVREEIDILSLGLNRNGALIKNGGRVSMLLSFKDGIGQDELTARMKSIEMAARSRGYGGFLGVSSGESGVDVKEMGLSPKDMDFKELQESCRREVYFRCGIPLPLIDNAAATDNNVAHAQFQFYAETVVQMCDLIYSVIGEAIASRDRLEYTCLTNQLIIPSLRGKLLEEVKIRKEIGIETINELRAHSNLEGIAGGDVVLVESRMISLDSLGESNNTGVRNDPA